MHARIRSVVVVSDAPPAALSFLSCRKRYGRKGALGYVWVPPASEFRRKPMFQASFHTIVTSRAAYCAPPDTGVSGLQLVALERLLSIEGALEIQMNFTFLRGPCRGGALLRPCFRQNQQQRAEQSPAPTARNTTLPAKRCSLTNSDCTFY